MPEGLPPLRIVSASQRSGSATPSTATTVVVTPLQPLLVRWLSRVRSGRPVSSDVRRWWARAEAMGCRGAWYLSHAEKLLRAAESATV
jgi:hypothetical protein